MHSQQQSTFSLSNKYIKLAILNIRWFDKDVKKNVLRRNFAYNRHNGYRIPSNKTNYTKMKNRVCELLRSKKREYFNDRLTRILNSPKRFFNELNWLTCRQKKNCNFKIADNENKLKTDDFVQWDVHFDKQNFSRFNYHCSVHYWSIS